MWPDLGVRSWQGVLTERLPREDLYEDDASDHLLEARESRRIHELRGLFLAQVAEVEDLMVNVLDSVYENRPDLIGGSRKKVILSRALAVVQDVMRGLELESLAEEKFPMLLWMIARRNQLVHARVVVGYSQLGPDAPREAVIVLLQEIQPRSSAVPWSDAPKLEGYRNPGDFGWDGDDGQIGEYNLEVDLRRLYVCLDAAVDVYEAVQLRLESVK